MKKWEDSYKIGVESVDVQHKQIFDISEKAYNLLQNDFCPEKFDAALKIIVELKEHVIYHFNSEEEYMKSIGYKELPAHRKEHEAVIKKVNGIDFGKFDRSKNTELLSVVDFVVNWTSNHILTRDKLIH